MPAGSKPGERRGGRAKGTPNGITLTIEQQIKAMFPDYNPVLAMAAMANHVPAFNKDGSMKAGEYTVPLEIKFKANKEVAEYLYPKRRAVEVSGPGGGPVRSISELALLAASQAGK